jgi:two-component sensor histidine kinase
MFASQIPSPLGPLSGGLARELSSARAQLASQDWEIRELNHRIANSLQLAADMLIFEQLRSRDPAARGALEASRARLIAVGQLHRHLHDQAARAQVGLREFLRDLGGAISGTTGLNCVAQSADIKVSGETAQRLGIIINECAINAAKHAYADQPGGRLDISCQAECGQLVLTIADHGRGLGGAATSGRSGLGMTIITAIVRELNGDLSLHDDGGLRVILRIPLSSTAPARGGRPITAAC